MALDVDARDNSRKLRRNKGTSYRCQNIGQLTSECSRIKLVVSETEASAAVASTFSSIDSGFAWSRSSSYFSGLCGGCFDFDSGPT